MTISMASFVGEQLGARFERLEAAYARHYAEAALRILPGSRAAVLERAGAVCAFHSPGSPLSHVFGLGLFAPCEPHDLDAIEAFYAACGDTRVQIELSPFARRGTIELLGARGYRVAGFEQLMARALDAACVAAPLPDGVEVHVVDPRDAAARATWIRVAGEGFFAPDGVPKELEGVFDLTLSVPGSTAFLATVRGEPAGAAALAVDDDVAALFGAATLPGLRRAGAHRALLDARLERAARAGARHATAGATCGSDSQRNMERAGYRVAYTRSVLVRRLDPAVG